jgi:hypothetical protein
MLGKSLTGLGACVVLVTWVACGSDDGKRTAKGEEAGAAGDGAGAESSGGIGPGAAGQPGVDGPAGAGGVDGAGGVTDPVGGANPGAGGTPDQAGGAGGAASTPVMFEIGAYVSPTGDNVNGDGTIDNPFETVSPAAAVVQAGQAIGFLDGNHIVDYFVQVPDGVALVGVNPGAATVGEMSGFNGGITFLGDGAIDGLRIGYAVNMFTVSAGTVRVTNTQFGAHGDGSGNDAAFRVLDTGELILEAPSPDWAWFWEPSGGRVAQMNDGTKLSVTGGVFEGGMGGSAFFVYSGAADMTFTDVSFVDCAFANVIGMNNGGIGLNASHLILDGVTIENSGTASGVYVGWGTPVVDITDSTIDTQNGTGIFVEASNYAGAEDQTVNVTNSVITGNSFGIRSYYYGQAILTLTDTDIESNATGVQFMYTDTDVGSTLDMTGGSIANNTGMGFEASSETNKPIKVKLRGVSVTGNGGNGMQLYGNAGAVFDLGTFADPGNNTLQNPGAANTSAAIVVNAPSLVNAIGNTWIASQQGANGSGKYVPVTGDYVEVTGAVATGQNYRIQAAGQTLRL